MARKSLRPQLNQIRTWVRQGRTDAWIAHQLEVSTDDIAAVKREHDLAPGEPQRPAPPPIGLEAETELLAEPEAELEQPAASEERDEQPARRRGGRGRGRRGGGSRGRTAPEPRTYEASFDHGEDGYGLWLDPAVVDDPIYIENWAGQRSVTVRVERDEIVIERADAAQSRAQRAAG